MSKLEIESERLQIRNLKLKDLIDFHFYRSNPEVTKYQGFDVYSMMEAEEFIQKQVNKEFGKVGEWVQYGVENKSTKKIIGDCAIRLDDVEIGKAEIGITISHIEQRKGYAKEALSTILDFLFTSVRIDKVVERLSVQNNASKRLLIDLGFSQDGPILKDVVYKGKVGDEYRYVILKDDWNKRV